MPKSGGDKQNENNSEKNHSHFSHLETTFIFYTIAFGWITNGTLIDNLFCKLNITILDSKQVNYLTISLASWA